MKDRELRQLLGLSYKFDYGLKYLRITKENCEHDKKGELGTILSRLESIEKHLKIGMYASSAYPDFTALLKQQRKKQCPSKK